MNLESKVSQLNRVGKTVAKQLKSLGIETVKDLLFYFPFRHEDYSQIVPINQLKIDEKVTVLGKIELIQSRRNFRTRRIITDAVVLDNTGRLRVIWFGQPFISKVLKAGDTVYLSGKIGRDKIGINMASPNYEKPRVSSDTTHTARVVPMYSLTSGITQKQLRFLVSQVINLASGVEDWLPIDLRERADVMPLCEAIKIIHFPENDADIKHARRRLAFDELFILQLRAEMIRQSLKRQIAPQIIFKENEIKEFVGKLPFSLTDSQKMAAWEIIKDMQKDQPMNRLLQGDVGSGKTVVGAMCAYDAILNNYQVVLMAPTEILASQHYESFVNLFGNTNVKIALYTRSKTELNFNSDIADYASLSAKKKYIGGKTKKNEINIIVGTHALLSEKVEFKKLGLVIVDEQQRFGVEQRRAIREKSGNANITPHFFSMTATPIPRSFALTIYGDLDISIIKGLPPGRKVIKTRLVAGFNRQKAYDFIRAQVKTGRQIFVVCPLIDNLENMEVALRPFDIAHGRPEEFEGRPDSGQAYWLDKKSVLSEYEKLSKQIFSDLKIGYLHGKLKSKEKDEVMKKFSNKELDILISTSVIEVGVNIPNASVMMIEGADRFGMAQLHQFRGRVGRSYYQSYCFLFTTSPPVGCAGQARIASSKFITRLEFFEKNNDGFKLAEFDLSERGPGEVYGTAQSGALRFKFANLRDMEIIKTARELASGLDFQKYPTLKNKVKEWENVVHLE